MRVRQSRSQLIALLAVALASVGGAYLLFVGVRGTGIWGTTNNGEFVDPPVAAEALRLRDADDRAFAPAGKWWIWIIAPDGCGVSCEAALAKTAQVRTLLHRDADRLRRGLVLDGLAAGPGIPADVAKFVGELGGLTAGAYIVDPLGNLVLWYSYDDVGKPLLEDLKRLFKVSQIG